MVKNKYNQKGGVSTRTGLDTNIGPSSEGGGGAFDSRLSTIPETYHYLDTDDEDDDDPEWSVATDGRPWTSTRRRRETIPEVPTSGAPPEVPTTGAPPIPPPLPPPLSSSTGNINIKNYSISRDGLVKITFRSNVRNESVDILRKQNNKLINLQQGRNRVVSDIGEAYQVFNSDPQYNLNETLTANEVYDLLTVRNIRSILRSFNILYSNNLLKRELIQLLSNMVQRHPERLKIVRETYANQVATQRLAAQNLERNVNESLLVSNQHKYSKADFEGMKFKDILRSLFDADYHRVFVYQRVLKRKFLPDNGDIAVYKIFNNVRAEVERKTNLTQLARQDLLTRLFREKLEKASKASDKILKENTHLVLDILFAARRPFYVDKRQYSILSYHQENGPTQDPSEGLEIPRRPNPLTFVIYPVEIYLELSEKQPDDITEKDIQGAGCHIRREKIRKDYYDLWNNPHARTGLNYVRDLIGMVPLPPPERTVFERKFNKTIKRRDVNNLVGGYKKTRRRKKNAGNPSPKAAIIEYLDYFPFSSKMEVTNFYDRINEEWGDFENGTNMLNIFSKEKKHVNNIQELLNAVKEAKETTFCDRKSGDGDCEETSDRVMELLPDNKDGKYTVESLRFEYYIKSEEDEDETPEFVQNHGILIFL